MPAMSAARMFARCGNGCAGIGCSNGRRAGGIIWAAGGSRLRCSGGRGSLGCFSGGLRCRRHRSGAGSGCRRNGCRSRRSRAHAKEFLRTAIRYAGNGFLQFFGHIFGFINGECAVPLGFVAVGFRAFVIHAAAVLHGGIIGGGLLRCGAQTRADKGFTHVDGFGRRSGGRGCLAGGGWLGSGVQCFGNFVAGAQGSGAGE